MAGTVRTLMKDGSEETADAAEESAVLRLGLNIWWRTLNYGIDVHRPLARFIQRQFSDGLDGRWRGSRGSAMSAGEDKRGVLLYRSIVWLGSGKWSGLRTVR